MVTVTAPVPHETLTPGMRVCVNGMRSFCTIIEVRHPTTDPADAIIVAEYDRQDARPFRTVHTIWPWTRVVAIDWPDNRHAVRDTHPSDDNQSRES